MTDEDRAPNVPVIRRDGFSITRASSRLVKRGLTALTESPKIGLDVHALIAFDSSIFVCHSDWDAQPNDWWDYREVELSDQHRQVVLYEFSHTGGYIRKLHLPLIRFSEAGYLRLSRRWPGRITIRQEFIHFMELLGFADSKNFVRVDYLFSRTGERIAAWANGRAIDHHRAEDESLTPSNSGIEPAWFVGDRIVSIRRGESGETGRLVDFLVSCKVNDLVRAVRNPTVSRDENSRLVSQVSTSPVCSREVDLRDDRGNRIKSHLVAQSMDFYPNKSNDPKASWIFIANGEYLGRIGMDGAEPTITLFPNPNGHDLLRTQDITLPDGISEANLSSEDWNRQSQPLSWEEDVLIEYFFELADRPNEFISRVVLMRIDGSRLKPMETIEPQECQFTELSFTDGRLVYVSGHGTQSEIRVINAHTDRAYSFRPQVLQSELDRGPSTHYQTY